MLGRVAIGDHALAEGQVGIDGKPQRLDIAALHIFAAHMRGEGNIDGSAEHLPSVTIALVTSKILDAPLLRFTVAPFGDTGLQRTSQIMIDKLAALPRADIGKIIGAIDDESMLAVERLLALFWGIAWTGEKKNGKRRS